MIPIKVELENFFSHKNSTVDFSDFSSALLIGNTEGDYGKSNGSGKSAIFESILWCLFNKSRVSMMDDIIMWGSATCFVELEFNHDNNLYKVRRSRSRMNSTSSVEFCISDPVEGWQDLSCSTAGDTNKLIEEITGLNYKTFINSVYFRQNDISEFAEAEASRKKEILKSIVDISRWDDYDKEARKKARDIKIECKVLQASVDGYKDLAEELAKTEGELGLLKDSIEKLAAKKASVVGQLDLLSGEYSLIKESLDTETYDKIIEKISSLKKDKERAANLLGEETALIVKYEKDKKAIENDIDNLSVSIKNLLEEEVPTGIIDSLRSELTTHKSSVASSKLILSNLNKIDLSSGACHVCEQNIPETLSQKLSKEYRERIDGHKKSVGVCKESIVKIEGKIEKWLEKEKGNSKIKEANASIEPLEYKLSLVKETLDKHVKEKKVQSNKLDNIKSELKTNIEILESIKNENFQNIRSNIQILKDEKEVLLKSIAEENKKIGRLQERESSLSSKKDAMEDNKEKLNEKLKSVALFDKLARMFGKNGIQTILLDAVIEDLEKASNKTLSSICNEPAVITLETQRPGADGTSIVETLDLKVRKDGCLQNFKSLSGGEKFRISLALRIALSEISSRYGGSSLEFLLLDEVNSPLDRFGVETLFINVIKSLEDKYKILVITHDEGLKERFDNVIDVTKVNGESQIEFIVR